MPASLAPITPELLADFRSGKEPAFEQIFRANFAALTKEAAERLEDEAASQKVVANTFLELWDRRAKIESAAQLETLLRQILTAGETHEMRRRASLHRMADTDGDHKNHEKHHVEAESVDQVWAHVVGALHAEKADPSVRARELAERHRHASAHHMAQVAKPTNTRFVVLSVIAVALVVFVPLWYFNQGAESTKAAQALSREDTRPMKSAAGQRGTVKLEDSTEVHIGSASTVKLTARFPNDFRAAEVTGTASFKAPVDKVPLLIKVGSGWVYASGTEFAVRHYADDSVAMIKVINGAATVKGENVERELAAGGMVQVNKLGVISDLSADRAAEAFGWMEGNFVMQNEELNTVLNEVKRWYGLDIVTLDSTLLRRPITMTASLESSKAAIAALEVAGNLKVGFQGLVMVVRDAPPAPAKKKGRK